ALHASESDLQWFSSGYALMLAAGMLPAGLLGDRFGRKKVLLASLFLFAVGSIASAYSTTSGGFIMARAILGIAGAGIITMALSAFSVMFTEEERPRAIGVWSIANFLALPIGPILGGWILTHYWWGWVFLVNTPVAALGLVSVLVLVPESRAAERPGLDPLGVLTSSAGLVALTYGLIEAGQNGWGSASALILMFVGCVILVVFVSWERWLGQRPGGQPLVDLALFRSAAFTWGVLLSTLAIVSFIAVLFTMPQYFQGILGLDAQSSGFRLLPIIVGMMIGAGPADRLSNRLGAKFTVALGLAVIAAGQAIGAGTAVHSSASFIALWMGITGVGFGLAMATAASMAISKLSAERSGVGSAVMQAIMKTGAPFGIAILGSVLNSSYQTRLHVSGLPVSAAKAVRGSVFGGLAVARQLGSKPLLDSVLSSFVHGMDVLLLVSAGMAVFGLLLALIFLPRQTSPRGDTISEVIESRG
ncbi:MAG: MFS transporter, partial [Bacilli bacterium]